MEEKKDYYYISLFKRTVSKVSVPDTVEYEVYAAPSDIEEFKRLLEDNHDRDFSFAAVNVPFKPFAEGEAEQMRAKSDDNLNKAFEFLYKFGTEETREKLKEVGYDQP